MIFFNQKKTVSSNKLKEAFFFVKQTKVQGMMPSTLISLRTVLELIQCGIFPGKLNIVWVIDF